MTGRGTRILLSPGPVVVLAALALLLLSSTELPPVGVHSNDLALHVSLARGLERNRTLDFWHQADLGYPVLRVYQPLYHIALATLDVATGSRPGLSALASYSVVLIALALPVGMFLGVRRWLVGEGVDAGEAGWGGAAAACLSTVSTSFTGFGFDPLQGSFGTFGVITQSLAMVFFAPAFAHAFCFVAGRHRSLLPALSLAFLVCASSLVVGVMLVACVSVRGVVEVVLGRDRTAARRLGSLLVGLGLVTVWLWWPLVQDSPWIYNPADLFARWVHAGFGLEGALKALLSGVVLDGRAVDRLARPPVMSLLFVAGVLAVGGARKQLPRTVLFLLGGWALWFSLFVGRDVWGPLLYAVPLLRSYQWGRFEAMLQYWAVVIVAIGLSRLVPSLWKRWRRQWQRYALAAVGLAAALMLFWSPFQLAAQNRRLLRTARAGRAPARAEGIAGRLVGQSTRVSVGGPLTWERQVSEDGIWMGVATLAWGVPTVGRIYQGMGIAAAAEYAWDGKSEWPARLFGVGDWLAPCTLMPQLPILAPPARVTPALCLGISREPPPLAFFSTLASTAPRRLREGQVTELQKQMLARPGLDCFLPFTLGGDGTAVDLPPRPQSLASVQIHGNRFAETGRGHAESRLDVEAPARGAIVFPVPYHPRLHAAVDGIESRPFPVVPGYAAVAVEKGRHGVTLVYESDRVKDTMLLITSGVLALAWLPWRLVARARPARHKPPS
jgi:hypothetical protein